MKFIETPVFTKDVRGALTDEEYRQLQLALIFRPEQGALIRGGAELTPDQARILIKLVRKELK